MCKDGVPLAMANVDAAFDSNFLVVPIDFNNVVFSRN